MYTRTCPNYVSLNMIYNSSKLIKFLNDKMSTQAPGGQIYMSAFSVVILYKRILHD